MISVVLAVRRRSGLRDCLDTLRPQVAAIGGELIVVAAGRFGERPAGPAVEVRVEAGDDALVPRLWGIGIQRARYPWVALTSTDCVPADDWIAAISRAVGEDPPCAAFGGPIDPPRHGSSTDWGLYFARFHAFLNPPGEGPDAGLPGENVAYRRAALERAWTDRDDGFWEAFVNRRLAALGETLGGHADLRVRMADGNRLTARARERIRHGLHFGSHRAVGGGLERGLRIAAAPVVPLLLTARAGLRVGRCRPALLARFLVALPWTLILFGAWSLGEARGYTAQRNRIRVPTNETPWTGR
ncbi:MAG TPA: hypothetical protein VFP76_04950 [Gemmatimonadota bacterium]|nr:hypothetical protein [Gemmatimonadota bacterium]